MFGGPEPLHRYNHCKHWSLLRSEPLQRRYRGVTGRYKWKRGPFFVKSTMEGGVQGKDPSPGGVFSSVTSVTNVTSQ